MSEVNVVSTTEIINSKLSFDFSRSLAQAAESDLINKAEKFKSLLNSSASIMDFNFFHFE